MNAHTVVILQIDAAHEAVCGVCGPIFSGGSLDAKIARDRHLNEHCSHPDSYVVREGITGLLGRVYCPDCEYEREWDAY
jgi:hypothetical protein